MLLSQDEVAYYRRLILEDHKAARKELAQLASIDHAKFIELSHELLQDPSKSIQWVILLLLGQYGDRNDPVAEAGALRTLADPELRRWALFALGSVATPAALPTLFAYAQQETPWALEAVSRQVTTEEEKQRLLHLARQYLLSQTYQLREEALNALLKHSNAAAEAALLLRAARLYYDELVIAALGKASPRVLPALRKLLATVSPDTAEYKDISRAIEKLQNANIGQ